MTDKKELLNVRLSPFDEETECLYFGYNAINHYTIRYLYNVMLWRYYERLSQKYDWGIEVETCNADLTNAIILEDAYYDDFYTLVEANYRLLSSIANRFGWELYAVEVDPDNPLCEKYSKGEISLETLLNTFEEMCENDKKVFLSCEDAFQDIGVMDGPGEIWVISHPKLGRYLQFRKENMVRIKELFEEEDKKIMELVDWLRHPLFLQFGKHYKWEEGRFLAAFACGYGMGGEIDFYYLTPQWLIGSFVTYELLLHAEQIFKYQ